MIKFKCETCGNEKFEMVTMDVRVVTDIHIDSEGVLHMGEQTNEDGGDTFFQCASCGERVGGEHVSSIEDIYEYLEEQSDVHRS